LREHRRSSGSIPPLFREKEDGQATPPPSNPPCSILLRTVVTAAVGIRALLKFLPERSAAARSYGWRSLFDVPFDDESERN